MTNQFNWLMYLEVAEHLLRQQGEAFYRSAVSRAYYGVFGHIRETLQRQGASFSTGSDVHRQVVIALRNDPRPEVARLGDHLENLRTQRNLADYQTDARLTLRWARQYQRRASRIRNRMANLLP